jgi:hypothetical protein
VVAVDGGCATLRVEPDLELHALTSPRKLHADGPSVLRLHVSVDQLRTAATGWADDVTRHPDAAPVY